jgi:hypothetical protein
MTVDEQEAINTLERLGYKIDTPPAKSVDCIQPYDVCYIIPKVLTPDISQWQHTVIQQNYRDNHQILMSGKQTYATIDHLNLTRELICLSYRLQPHELPETDEYTYELCMQDNGLWGVTGYDRDVYSAAVSMIPRELSQHTVKELSAYMNVKGI